MAILRTCCCFDNVRAGSMASAIYTLAYTPFVLAFAAWQVAIANEYNYNAVVKFVYVFMIIGLVLWALVLLASIFVLVGIQMDQRGYLLPYMIAMPLVILFQCAYVILIIFVILALLNRELDVTLDGLIFAMILTFTILDVFCLLTVVSQYQDLQAGRGRRVDVINFRALNNPTVFTSQAPCANVLVTQQGGYPQTTGYVMQAPPPSYAAQAQQGGYPAQQGGYPAQQGGYPAQQGGYPAQQEGCPTQQGDYPAQQGGNPAQQEGFPAQQGYAPEYPPEQAKV